MARPGKARLGGAVEAWLGHAWQGVARLGGHACNGDLGQVERLPPFSSCPELSGTSVACPGHSATFRDMRTKTRQELETIIRRAADEQQWEVFSEDPRVMRKLALLHGPGKPKGEGAVWLLGPTELSFRRRRALDAAARQRLADRLAASRKTSG